MCWFFKYEILFLCNMQLKECSKYSRSYEIGQSIFYTFVSLEVSTINYTCSKLYIKKRDD